jgi:hypothetical protein
MTRFAIEDSFALDPDRFVFAGRVLEGRVEHGMIFDVPEAGHRWRLSVQSVEFLRKAGRDLIGLVVRDDRYLPGWGVGWTTELHEPGT